MEKEKYCELKVWYADKKGNELAAFSKSLLSDQINTNWTKLRIFCLRRRERLSIK